MLSAGHIYTSDSPTSSRLRRFITSSSGRHKQSTPTTTAAAAQEGGKGDRELDRDRDVGGTGGVKAMARKLWMGSETVGWEERRVAREQEVLDEGAGVGYGELIGESIMEVFGKKEKDEERKAD